MKEPIILKPEDAAIFKSFMAHKAVLLQRREALLAQIAAIEGKLGEVETAASRVISMLVGAYGLDEDVRYGVEATKDGSIVIVEQESSQPPGERRNIERGENAHTDPD